MQTTAPASTSDYRHLVREINIKASAAQVWAVLTDFASYPTWSSFIMGIEGEGKPAGHLKTTMVLPGKEAQHFQPRITAWEEQRHFAWLGQLWFGGLFDGEHHFELHSQPDGSTLLIQHEYFRGLLVPMLKSMLVNETAQGFEQFNEAVKREVERRASLQLN